jgi:hypothetical protein
VSGKKETEAVFRFHLLQRCFYGVCYVYYFVFLFGGDGECFHDVSPGRSMISPLSLPAHAQPEVCAGEGVTEI